MTHRRDDARVTRFSARRLTGLGAVLVLLSGVVMVTLAVTAQAATGVWGAGRSGYTDGLICTQGGATTPLVSWPVAPGGAPAYLVRPISSAGGVDTGSPPRAGVTAPVRPGEFGFTSPAQIATYAALLNTYSDGGPSANASIAELIQEKSGQGNNSGSCYGSTLDRNYTAALLTSAAQRVGPLRVSTVLPTTPVRLGEPATVTTTVTYASGAAAAGVAVTVTTGDGTVGDDTVTTDSSGVATTTVTTRNPNLPTVAVTSTVDSFTGLQVTTAPGAVPALSVAPPEQVSGTATAPVDQSANPTATLTTTAATSVGQLITPVTEVTGMNSHSGRVTVTTTGPVPFDPRTFCTAIPAAAFTGAPVAGSSTTEFTGDGAVSSPGQRVTAPGCYRSIASVSTTNAVPPVTVASPPATPVAVIDTTVTAAVGWGGVAGGGAPRVAALTVSNARGLPGTMTVETLGPVDPGAGRCADVAWDRAPRATAPLGVPVAADGPYLVSVPAPAGAGPESGAGCYRIGGTVTVDVPGAGPVSVSSNAAVAAVVAPGLAVAPVRQAVSTPDPVAASVTLLGTYGYRAQVFLDVFYAPGTSLVDCEGVDWSQVSASPTVGAPTAATGDGTYRVTSGATSGPGCYAMAPRVVFVDNPGAVFTVGPAGQRNAVLVGVSPARTGVVSGLSGSASGLSGSGSALPMVALYAVAVVVGLGVAGAAFLRRLPPEDEGEGEGTAAA